MICYFQEKVSAGDLNLANDDDRHNILQVYTMLLQQASLGDLNLTLHVRHWVRTVKLQLSHKYVVFIAPNVT